ncbi:envelope stress response membrane protein PspC [Vibrio maerlii]|uniref:envelope stress response membrane protein PspC n=1 Tax=Vibrio maerlii TaxID=2231648 RepID=UPI000E3B93A7|nr:envelope stress response membrane protein PspC [Vibrio maerlii]
MASNGLYRDVENRKLTGVCAGLANYFGIEVWLVRILFMSAALLGGLFLVVLAYIALTLMVEKQPANYVNQVKMQQDHTLKSKPWKAGKTPSALLSNIHKDVDQMETSLRNIEAYVTSDAFKVNREFNKL